PKQAKKKPSTHNISNKHKKTQETLIDKPGPISSGEIEQSTESVVYGNELFSMEKYEEAIKSFDKSLQIDPGNNTAWNNKGMALARSGKFAEAIQCYDKALEINPDDYVVLNNKGSTLYKKGNIKEAMECYKSALDLNAESGTAIHGMEICLKYLKKSMKN
ncbi:MAG TPA: tetratricopeptide repeat protein, partial [Candidatus Methanoperedens sp.]